MIRVTAVQLSNEPLLWYRSSIVSEATRVQIGGRFQLCLPVSLLRYWRYNEEMRTMDPGYPKPITVWRGVPDSPQGAFVDKANGTTYPALSVCRAALISLAHAVRR